MSDNKFRKGAEEGVLEAVQGAKPNEVSVEARLLCLLIVQIGTLQDLISKGVRP